jgi:hypothetical protein
VLEKNMSKLLKIFGIIACGLLLIWLLVEGPLALSKRAYEYTRPTMEAAVIKTDGLNVKLKLSDGRECSIAQGSGRRKLGVRGARYPEGSSQNVRLLSSKPTCSIFDSNVLISNVLMSVLFLVLAKIAWGFYKDERKVAFIRKKSSKL